MIGADGKEDVPHREWLVVFDRVLDQVKAELAKQGRADDFTGAKVRQARPLELTNGTHEEFADHLQHQEGCYVRRD